MRRPGVHRPPGIDWQPWALTTFAAAERERKPLYINVCARWCHWCHAMDHETLADPGVQEALAGFVCLRVDADERLDLAERYADWAWPANILLTPKAQPWAELRGYQEARPFRDFLLHASREAASGRMAPRPPAPVPPPAVQPLAELRDQVAARLASFHDARRGGWGDFQKYPFPGPVEAALLRHARGNEGALEEVRRTLQGTQALLDPVWGGCWQYSTQGRWDRPHYEKTAAVQAAAITAFTLGWQRTRDPAWRGAADRTVDYVLRWLELPEGGFAASQDADCVQPDGTAILGSHYYRRSDAKRRAIGLPAIDPTPYADLNGLLVCALVQHADATGDPRSLAAALRAGRRLRATHREPAGNIRHTPNPSPVHYLRDNACVGRALVALHQATGDPAWLREAEAVTRFLLDKMQAPGGGFYAHTAHYAATGVFTKRRLPLEDNGVAIRFLVEVAWRTKDLSLAHRLRASALLAARVLAHPERVAPEAQIVGQFLLGLEWLLMEPPRVVLVGDDLALRAAARALDAAGLVVAQDASFPNWPSPAAYACRGTACSRPATNPQELALAWQKLHGPLLVAR